MTACAVLLGATASRAEPPPPRDWELAIFGYGWLIASEASFETEFGVFEVDRGIRDNLEDLDFAAMGAAQFRYRRFVALLDGVWTDLSNDSSVVNGRVDGDATLAYLDGKLGVRLLDRAAPWADASRGDAPRVRFDLLGGARYWYTRAELDGRFPNVADRQVDETRDWVDLLVGARVLVGILPTLNVSVVGDVGGFDMGNSSELTWMVMPTLNWRPWRRWSFHAGYKFVRAERERPSTNRDLDVELSGPVVGVGFHF
jgi:hypothetical protein